MTSWSQPFSGFGLFVPDGKLFLRDFPSLDPGEATFVFPAVLLKHLIAPAALHPFLNGDGATAELPGRAGSAAIFRRDAPGDGEVSPAVPTPPDRELPPDALPQKEVYQVTNRVGI